MAEPRPLIGNAADEAQLRRGGRLEQRRERRRLDAYRTVLATPAGRFVFADLLDQAGFYQSSFFGESALTMAYVEGGRNAGIKLRALLEDVDATAVELMEREARDRRRNDAKENDAGHTPAATEEN